MIRGFIIFFSVLCVSAGLTRLIIHLAERFGWISYPKDDRWHTKPTALMGGIAIFLAVSVFPLFVSGVSTLNWWILSGATIMFVTGLYDDLSGISPFSKLFFQAIAASILIYGDLLILPGWPVWFCVPLTFVWVIGITNSINLLDNMDGLAAGISCIVAIVFALYAIHIHEITLVYLFLAVSGASAGFLIFNFKPAKIFMGDSGSLFLGYCIAAGGLVIHNDLISRSIIDSLILPILILLVPVFDTLYVTVSRMKNHKSIFEGGRDHISHRLVKLGFREKTVVLSFYLVAILFALSGFFIFL